MESGIKKHIDIMNTLTGRELNDRESEILQKIVHLYIVKATPIGSRFLSKYIQDELKLSPATLRNVMSDLEEMHYISHPHTSAGRIPTDKGYRFYVDNMQKIENLNSKEITSIQDNLAQSSQENILHNASRLLGMLSKYLSVVQMPNFKNYIVQKIELVELSSTKILIVLALESNFVRTVTLELDFEIDHKFIDSISKYINEKISGKPLKFIKENFSGIMEEYDQKNTPLVRLFTDSVDKIFDQQASGQRLVIAGTKHLLSYPEFEDLQRVRSVIELIENEEIIIHLLDKYEDSEGIKILIGKELDNGMFEDYSLIRSSYQIGSASGSIGIIGPKRMNYSKMISLIQLFSQVLTHYPE